MRSGGGFCALLSCRLQLALQAPGGCCGFVARQRGLIHGLLRGPQQTLPLRFPTFPVFAIIGIERLGAGHQRRWHPHPPSDSQALARATHTPLQAIGGRQALCIETHTRQRHTFMAQGIAFHHFQMAGEQCAGFGRQQGLCHRLGQCAPLPGIGTVAQFIKKHKTVGIGVPQHFLQALHLRRKGRKIRVNILGIANDRKALSEIAQSAFRRHRQPHIGHQMIEPHRFQGSRLATGIGAGNHQLVRVHPEMYRVTHNLPRMTQTE